MSDQLRNLVRDLMRTIEENMKQDPEVAEAFEAIRKEGFNIGLFLGVMVSPLTDEKGDASALGLTEEEVRTGSKHGFTDEDRRFFESLRLRLNP